MSAALKLVPVRMPQTAGVKVSSDNSDWQFNPATDGTKHFWSTNGEECLWCGAVRMPAEIAAWRRAGEPEQACGIQL